MYEKIINFITPFLLAFLFSLILTPLIRRIALKFKILDWPEIGGRKIHLQPVPLLGGIVVFLSFFLALVFLLPHILSKNILFKNIAGVFLASLVLMIGGFLDDKYNLKPKQQIIFPILASLIIIASGIGVKFITNPFNGIINLESIKIKVLTLKGIPYFFSFPSDFITFIWLMLLMYTTKFLDGLDGLVSGITVIGALIIFSLTIFTKFFQPEVSFLAIILAGSFLGFLIFNFHPAKIFLGEGGSLFSGFILGTLAIISGGKFATALIVLGIPILDVFWIILRRIFKEKKYPWLADKKHLHFRLLDVGLTHRQAVFSLYFLALFFGLFSLFLKSFAKLITLGILILVILLLAFILVIIYRSRSRLNAVNKTP